MNKQELILENKLLRENIELKDRIQDKNYIFHCANCGNPFVLNQSQYDRRKNKGNSFYCSAGHGNVFNS